MTTLLQVPGDDPRVVRLATAQQDELARRYAETPDHGFAQPPLHPATTWLLLEDDDGAAIGCVALQPLSHTQPGAADDQGEVKRLYVAQPVRGRGLSRTLMAELEALAARAGFRELRLETGLQQPEALALYRGLGYREIAPYGHYRCSPQSVCLAKALPPHDPTA